MDKESSIDVIREIAKRVIDETTLELVHAEFGSTSGTRTVRVFIDRDTGVTHDDCALVSHGIEQALDLEDPVSGKYILEVSSPGIERGLYSLDDFEKFAGKSAKIRTHEAVKGQKNFRGIIKGVTGTSVEIEDITAGKRSLAFDLIKKANLEFDAEKELRMNQGKKKRER